MAQCYKSFWQMPIL